MFYKEALDAARSGKLAKERRIEAERMAEESISLLRAYKSQLTREFTKKYWESEHIILNCFDMLEKAVTEEDVNLFAKGINDLAFSFEKVLQFKNFEEFDEFMQTNQMLML